MLEVPGYHLLFLYPACMCGNMQGPCVYQMINLLLLCCCTEIFPCQMFLPHPHTSPQTFLQYKVQLWMTTCQFLQLWCIEVGVNFHLQFWEEVKKHFVVFVVVTELLLSYCILCCCGWFRRCVAENLKWLIKRHDCRKKIILESNTMKTMNCIRNCSGINLKFWPNFRLVLLTFQAFSNKTLTSCMHLYTSFKPRTITSMVITGSKQRSVYNIHEMSLLLDIFN